ncbi:MAG: serine/threonine-protein kinase, partial [Nannocystaceae bacterium]
MTLGDGIRTGGDVWDLADDVVLAAVKARLLGGEVVAPSLAGYELEVPLGAGAMGRIVRARDPKLDRVVALKLIAPHLAHEPVARERIVAEARAMAKLSDPHVAQVYEVGQDGEQMFVAMEYVDGQPLRTWLQERERPWSQIVEVFVQAGRGLAAAHAKGLVHRDFKPDNVMLEQSGRAKVVDFGLARDFGEAELRTLPGGDGPAGLTRTGAWLGTPAYMAPEQWEGGRVDARSDQFSFCVALFEALAGTRPFPGESAEEIRAALARARVPRLGRSRSGRSRVPRRIEAAIARGLQLDPQRRWPAMEPLLQALTPRSWLRVAAVAVPVVSVLAAAVALGAGDDDACEAADSAMDALWSDQVRGQTETALSAVDAPWAPATSAAVLPHLDRAAQAWRSAAAGVCVTADSKPERSRCLDRAREEIERTIEQARSGEAIVAVGLVARAELLVDARRCLQPAAVAWLQGGGPDVELARSAREMLEQATRRLGALSTSAGAERYVASLAAGRTAAAQALATAREAGDRALVARASWMVGRLATRDSDRAGAEQALREAMDAALEVGDAGLRAAAMIDLVYVVGNDRDRTAEALALGRDAEAMLGTLGEHPVSTARLAAHRASTYAHAEPSQAVQAIELHEEAVAILRQVLGDSHPDVIVALGNLGSALSYTERDDDVRARLSEALQRARRV